MWRKKGRRIRGVPIGFHITLHYRNLLNKKGENLINIRKIKAANARFIVVVVVVHLFSSRFIAAYELGTRLAVKYRRYYSYIFLLATIFLSTDEIISYFSVSVFV